MFAQPVIYQADHPKARREITELQVSAPDEAGAITHAIRVVQGDVAGLTIAPFTDLPLPPAVELPSPDIRHEFR
jgi:hypothetical protein